MKIATVDPDVSYKWLSEFIYDAGYFLQWHVMIFFCKFSEKSLCQKTHLTLVLFDHFFHWTDRFFKKCINYNDS